MSKELGPLELLTFTREPWQHQKDALVRFADEPTFALWHDMGVGKTTTAILILRWKYLCHRQVLPTLIISPVATLWNWQDEFKKNAPEGVSSAVQVLYGSGVERVKMLADPAARIFITNPECLTMPTVVEELVKKNFYAVVLDEAHKFKDHKAKRFAALLKVSDRASVRGMLTGTPILKSYLDIWAQFRFLDKGRTFFPNFYVFMRKYFVDKNAGMPKEIHFPKWEPAPEARNEFLTKLEPLVSRVKKSACLDLPPLIKTVKVVEMSDEQRKVYETMLRDLIIEVEQGTCAATNALTKTLRLLQILSGYLPLKGESDPFGDVQLFSIKNNPRLKQLEEDLEDLTPDHKVIVWSNFADSYDDILAVARRFGEVAELTGRTKDRAGEIKRFNEDPKCRVILSNPQAGGVGVNLTAASYSIWYSRGYSLGDRLQAEARNYRGGSEVHKQIVQIDYVSPGTVDEDVLNVLEEKEEMGNRILSVLRAIPKPRKKN